MTYRNEIYDAISSFHDVEFASTELLHCDILCVGWLEMYLTWTDRTWDAQMYKISVITSSSNISASRFIL